jgi:hypothetical protein
MDHKSIPFDPEIKPDDIHRQLERILAHTSFKASQRCQTLLQFLVENALHDVPEHPKERTLGIEVFGRSPDYNTSDDPIVRGTASDIRKRIAQYYFEPAHRAELRIDLPAGSYLPKFYLPQAEPALVSGESAESPSYQADQQNGRAHSRKNSILFAALLFLSVCGMYVFENLTAKSALDRFWDPLTKTDRQVLISVLAASASDQSAACDPLGFPTVTLTDHRAALQIVHFLDTLNVKSSETTQSLGLDRPDSQVSPTLAELRQNPVVFVGNSDWAQRLFAPMRFHFMRDPSADLYWIEDSQDSSSRKWAVKMDQKFDSYAVDYALISRVQERTTGQTIVAVTGLGSHATAAAAEFVTSPAEIALVADSNSPEWKKNNVQIVISTRIAGSSWGTPQVVAKYFW